MKYSFADSKKEKMIPIPEHLHRAAKSFVSSRGGVLKKWVAGLIEDELEREKIHVIKK